jgi:hypothetical protein
MKILIIKHQDNTIEITTQSKYDELYQDYAEFDGVGFPELICTCETPRLIFFDSIFNLTNQS